MTIPWTVRVLTLFPQMFPGPLSLSLIGKARHRGLWNLEVYNLRDFSSQRSVDDLPFGGGPGMVLCPEVVDEALTSLEPKGRALYLSPRGRPIDQEWIQDLSTHTPITFLCGRYEGVDERAIQAHDLEEVSLGDFILSCGELAALCVIDACVRLLPGVIGNHQASLQESFVDGLLEYPHYTRPALWIDKQGREYPVPEVLRSGHHQRIERWRLEQAKRLTAQRRPDLWNAYREKHKE